jgi:hypothetical protein
MAKTTAEQQKSLDGRVMAIPLGDGSFGYCRALTAPNTEFYDLRSTELLDPAQVVQAPVLFRIWVMKYAFTGRRWKRIGNMPLRESESGKIWWYFKQDDGGNLFRTRNGLEEIPADSEEVKGMECAAVWDPEHVEDRLRDHFAGKPNKWVESLKPKRT